jgi:hypothetical protein
MPKIRSATADYYKRRTRPRGWGLYGLSVKNKNIAVSLDLIRFLFYTEECPNIDVPGTKMGRKGSRYG